jgi:hypothetical protein
MRAPGLRGLGDALRRHWLLVTALVLALALRVVVALAYPPALFFGGDSSQYLKLALTGDPVGVAFERPSGYPLLIHAVFWLGRSLTLLIALQHLAGLVTGVLTYALARRLGLKTWLAAALAALVLFDAYALALEQHVLAEAFFTPLLVGSLLLAVGPGSAAGLAASGLLLGIAVTVRTEALFALPVWLIAVVWARPGWRPALAAVVACALPLGAYAVWHHAETGRYGLTEARGWFLYARIGEIGDCAGVDVPAAGRALCRRVPGDDREGASYHLWAADGTAHRAFGSLTGSLARERHLNDVMWDHAVAIIRDRPWRYTGMVAADVARYFEPGVASRSISDTAISFPESGQATGLDPRIQRRWFQGTVTEVRGVSSFVRSYAGWVHTPRWLMGLLVLSGIAGIVTGPRRRELFLLVGVPMALLIGATATSDFILRYLIPTVPLLLCGGFAGAQDVWVSLTVRRGKPPRAQVSLGASPAPNPPPTP